MLSKREFGNYFDTYSDAIYNFVYYKLNLDRELAFDMTQDIFFKALRSLEKFDKKKASFKTWIYTIANNSVIDYYRTVKENSNIDDMIDLLPYYDSINDSLDHEFDLKKIYQELNTLPSTTKEIIVLRIFEELSFKEIAEILGMSEGACKMQYKRGITQIQTQILSFLICIILMIF